MTLLTVVWVVFILALMGFVLWLFNVKVTAIDPTIKQVINFFVVAVAVIFVLDRLGLFRHLGSVRVH